MLHKLVSVQQHRRNEVLGVWSGNGAFGDMGSKVLFGSVVDLAAEIENPTDHSPTHMKTVIWGSVQSGGSFVFLQSDFSECSNRSESVRNRKYGLFAIDNDVQIFFWVRLRKKLELFEILSLKMQGIPYTFPFNC